MISINILQLSILYALILIMAIVLKHFKVGQSKLLLIGSIRMTIQLALAGFILTYILGNPNPWFTIIYVVVMTIFSIFMVFSRNKGLSKRWKVSVVIFISLFGVFFVAFFVGIIVGANVFNPQYTIPLSGMIIGNIMTGVSLSIKSYRQSLLKERLKIITLTNLGVEEKKINLPIIVSSLEVALLPTINSMMGMGIISLPGMMTGQILAGSSAETAILYQIAIVLLFTIATTISIFAVLHFGSKHSSILFIEKNVV